MTAAEARRKYEAAKLAADEAERARLAAESLAQEAESRKQTKCRGCIRWLSIVCKKSKSSA